MNEREPCLELRGLEAGYPARGSWLRRGPRHVPVIDRVDLDVRCGETVGLVGESGSGKTTLSRAALRLVEPTAGTIRFRGRDFRALTGRALPVRRGAGNPNFAARCAADAPNLRYRIENRLVAGNRQPNDLIAERGTFEDDVINFAVVRENIDRNFRLMQEPR